MDLQLQEALLADPLGLVLRGKDLVNLFVSSHFDSEGPPLHQQRIVHGVVIIGKQVKSDAELTR